MEIGVSIVEEGYRFRAAKVVAFCLSMPIPVSSLSKHNAENKALSTSCQALDACHITYVVQVRKCSIVNLVVLK